MRLSKFLAKINIFSSIVDRSPLTNYNVSGTGNLPAKNFYS